MNKERIFYVPDTLHPATANLVGLFAEALAFKMDAAQKKYGYTNNWMRPDWMNICRAHLLQHLGKGDPRDVAAYCAFLWHHGESTTAPLPQSTVGLAQALQLAHEHMQLYLQHYTENHNVYEAVMAALTAQPAQEQEPVAWVVFASNGNCRIWFGDKASAERWADATGVRSLLQPLYTAPPTAAAADVPPDALDLLRIWKTWLGSSREQCDNTGKRLWDRIEAVLAGKPAVAITDDALLEAYMAGFKKQPMTFDSHLTGLKAVAELVASQPPAVAVPEGYELHLVPKESTDAFNAACSVAFEESRQGTGPCGVFIAGYRHMLAAAPQAGQEGGEA